MSDRYGLERFVTAQDGIWEQARRELRRGRKTSHWMWFVFPQLRGLGSSAMAQHYAISGLDEAADYLAHPLLGSRLREASQIVATSQTATATELFGSVDALKLRSSMTLFQVVTPQEVVFGQVLGRYFDGPDTMTLRLLH